MVILLQSYIHYFLVLLILREGLLILYYTYMLPLHIHAKRENKMPLTKIFSPNVSFRNLLAELQ